jgi:hypothetical protein
MIAPVNRGPFISNALGAPHEYDTGFADEVALLVFVEAPDTGATQNLRCRMLVTDDWLEVPHTYAQAAQVQTDLTVWQNQPLRGHLP